jgi:hypothetical protein
MKHNAARWMQSYYHALCQGRAVALIRWTQSMAEVSRGKLKTARPPTFKEKST